MRSQLVHTTAKTEVTLGDVIFYSPEMTEHCEQWGGRATLVAGICKAGAEVSGARRRKAWAFGIFVLASGKVPVPSDVFFPIPSL